MNGTLSLVGDSNEDDIGAGPAKKSRPSDQGYAGLPPFQPVEPRNIDQNSRVLRPEYQEQPRRGQRPENYQQHPSHSGRSPLVPVQKILVSKSRDFLAFIALAYSKINQIA